ncbi:hypothetical protein AB0C08_31545, partial [Microbispora bryophytorum]
MIRAILFDLDETLFDHRRAVAHAATRWTESVCPGHELLPETPALWLDLEDKHVPAWQSGECSLAEQRRRRLRGQRALPGLPRGHVLVLQVEPQRGCLRQQLVTGADRLGQIG